MMEMNEETNEASTKDNEGVEIMAENSASTYQSSRTKEQQKEGVDAGGPETSSVKKDDVVEEDDDIDAINHIIRHGGTRLLQGKGTLSSAEEIRALHRQKMQLREQELPPEQVSQIYGSRRGALAKQLGCDNLFQLEPSILFQLNPNLIVPPARPDLSADDDTRPPFPQDVFVDIFTKCAQEAAADGIDLDTLLEQQHNHNTEISIEYNRRVHTKPENVPKFDTHPVAWLRASEERMEWLSESNVAADALRRVARGYTKYFDPRNDEHVQAVYDFIVFGECDRYEEIKYHENNDNNGRTFAMSYKHENVHRDPKLPKYMRISFERFSKYIDVCREVTNPGEYVRLWVDMIFSKRLKMEGCAWDNVALIPYAIHPTIFIPFTGHETDRLWMCCEMYLAMRSRRIYTICDVKQAGELWGYQRFTCMKLGRCLLVGHMGVTGIALRMLAGRLAGGTLKLKECSDGRDYMRLSKWGEDLSKRCHCQAVEASIFTEAQYKETDYYLTAQELAAQIFSTGEAGPYGFEDVGFMKKAVQMKVHDHDWDGLREWSIGADTREPGYMAITSKAQILAKSCWLCFRTNSFNVYALGRMCSNVGFPVRYMLILMDRNANCFGDGCVQWSSCTEVNRYSLLHDAFDKLTGARSVVNHEDEEDYDPEYDESFRMQPRSQPKFIGKVSEELLCSNEEKFIMAVSEEWPAFMEDRVGMWEAVVLSSKELRWT